ncbi:MAG: hypothetical protein QXF58_05085 [Desulfurococcaceae archaeon]
MNGDGLLSKELPATTWYGRDGETANTSLNARASGIWFITKSASTYGR